MDERTTVLYVDDNPKSSRLLAGVLEECGFRMISKNDPREALALCRRTSFDLALLDYEMPVMTGAQLAREIKHLMPEVPIILISGAHQHSGAGNGVCGRALWIRHCAGRLALEHADSFPAEGGGGPGV